MKNVFATTLTAVLGISAILFAVSCSSGDSYTTTTMSQEPGKLITHPSGLQYIIVNPGTGATALPGHQVKVNYTGKLSNGAVFDTSIGREPFTFTLNAGQVILGWDIGVAGMRVGEKRKLIIPASLGYGSGGMGNIPPNATLYFEVDLLEVK